MTQFNSIDDILNNSDFDNILVPEPAKISQTKTIDQRLVDSFVEINEFFKENKFAPSSASKDINQRKLNARLESFKTSPDKIIILKEYDQYNLLPEIKEIESIENNYELNEKEENLDIFKLQHITNINRAETDFVAHRKPCKDFAKFESLFKECHVKLKSGQYKLVNLVSYNKDNIKQDSFFVLNGVVTYLSKLYNENIDEKHRWDGRTRLIFENGTESSMKIRTFGKILSTNGKLIIPNIQTNLMSSENIETGYIYVLKSLSTNPEISSIKNLYKIGYASTTVEQRIKNAKTDPTYLNSDVKIVATFKTIDLNPQKLENLLHRFFADSCLNVLIDDGKGGKLKPREWFIVPLEVIEETINLIINGNITNYRYSTSTEANELNI
jgi:hypothetical protein